MILEEKIEKAVTETLNKFVSKIRSRTTNYVTLYEGFSRSAYQGGAHLANAIRRNNDILASSFKLNESVSYEPAENERGGIIVFSTDVNAITLHNNKVLDYLKQKVETITNKLNATRKIDKIAAENNLVGWTIGRFLNGRYTAKNGKQYGENSLSVEIIGVDFNQLLKIAEQLCRSFTQESVLLKDYSTNRVLFVDAE